MHTYVMIKGVDFFSSEYASITLKCLGHFKVRTSYVWLVDAN